MNRRAIRVALERIKKNLFGLGITTVGHIDIGFGDRIDTFICIDGRQAGLAEISLNQAAATGIDTLTARFTEH
ncbi:hypothetical protein [Denitromonas sp.]|uniref:hypothetical protein n=1 Tax=Denitromonas sp. TaxID=2734609 RepID=UPI002FDEE510